MRIERGQVTTNDRTYHQIVAAFGFTYGRELSDAAHRVPARVRVKRCARCRRSLRRSAFPRNPRLRDGLGSWCRSCQVARTREWRAEHAAEINSRKRAIHARNRDTINARRRELYRSRQGARPR